MALHAASEIAIARPLGSRIAAALRALVESRLAFAGLLLVALMVGTAVLAPLIAPYAPNAMDYTALLRGPGPTHLLGTDDLGRDILTRVIYGSRRSPSIYRGARPSRSSGSRAAAKP